jgi:serine/threonine protein kinase
LALDPAKRPTPKEALTHPWLSDKNEFVQPNQEETVKRQNSLLADIMGYMQPMVKAKSKPITNTTT